MINWDLVKILSDDLKSEWKSGTQVFICGNGGSANHLANDTGYENIFSNQLSTLAESKDILIVFSGSGNSPNVVEALLKAHEMGMNTHAILGFDGGKCKELAYNPIHIPINNMQVSEDFQMMIGHILMLDLKEKTEKWVTD